MKEKGGGGGKRGALLLHIYLIIRSRPEGSPGGERVRASTKEHEETRETESGVGRRREAAGESGHRSRRGYVHICKYI